MDVKGDACGLRLKQRHPRRSGQAQDHLRSTQIADGREST